jgi:hypothetical protein
MSLLTTFGINDQQVVINTVTLLGDNLIGATLSDGRKVYVGKKTADEPSNFLPKTPQNQVPCAAHMVVKNINGALWLIDGRKSSTPLPTF